METLDLMEILPVRKSPGAGAADSLTQALGSRADGVGTARRQALLEELRGEGSFPGIEAFAALLIPAPWEFRNSLQKRCWRWKSRRASFRR
jgi:hypothetical protein